MPAAVVHAGPVAQSSAPDTHAEGSAMYPEMPSLDAIAAHDSVAFAPLPVKITRSTVLSGNNAS